MLRRLYCISRYRNDCSVTSDQGIQYGSDDWQRFCRANNLALSIIWRGNCWDIAVAESFFSSLKKERIRKRIYKTQDLARADIFAYIEVFYNRARHHNHLGGISLEAFVVRTEFVCGRGVSPVCLSLVSRGCWFRRIRQQDK